MGNESNDSAILYKVKRPLVGARGSKQEIR